MSVWALSDPHLAFGVPSKSMDVFGPQWQNYAEKIRENWLKLIKAEDLVLLPGDICWALKLEEALVDLRWIDALPGTKVMIRGNHDYWWSSNSKMAKVMPPSIHFIHNNAFDWNDISIGGTRLWDTQEYNFNQIIDFQPNPRAHEKPPQEESVEEQEKIFLRELERLRMSLKCLNPNAKKRIAMTHYPPIGIDLKPSKTAEILEEFKIDVCAFGHLHNVKPHAASFGQARGVRYLFTSCDYLNFVPLKVF